MQWGVLRLGVDYLVYPCKHHHDRGGEPDVRPPDLQFDLCVPSGHHILAPAGVQRSVHL
jgi:hypothetical protein